MYRKIFKKSRKKLKWIFFKKKGDYLTHQFCTNQELSRIATNQGKETAGKIPKKLKIITKTDLTGKEN